ncbi:MAG: hypothetical protein JWM31_684 [Solirubrobacterales bacterium]|nr:hypothetical protein [Solirubrobacterales bacterium]
MHAISRRSAGCALVVATGLLVAVAPAGAIVGGVVNKTAGPVVFVSTGSTAVVSCTGVLLAPAVVLTTKRCATLAPKSLRVNVGVLSAGKTTGAEPTSYVPTRVRTSAAGLAYLELGRPTTVKPARISPFKTPAKGGSPSVNLHGFGSTFTLRSADAKLVTCPSGGSFGAGVLCTRGAANAKGQSLLSATCKGDEGAPLFYGGNGTPSNGSAREYALVGLARTPSPCQADSLSSYTDVAAQDDFMKQALAPRLTGRVFDKAGAIAVTGKQGPERARITAQLGDAIVRAYGPGHKLASSTPTFGAGTFTLPVAAGTYTIEVSSAGYRTLSTPNVKVTTAQPFDAGLTRVDGCSAGSAGSDDCGGGGGGVGETGA